MSKFNYIEFCENIQSDSQKPHFYKITNLINGKYYYGVHDGADTENYEGSGLLLHQAYEKYGIQNFKKQILKEFETEDEAYAHEELIVDEKMIRANNPMCYNIRKGGKGGDTYSMQTPERQAEIRQKRIDSINNRSEEQKLQTKQKQKNAWNNKTEEQKNILSKNARDKRKDTIKITDGKNEKQVSKIDFINIWQPIGWIKGIKLSSEKKQQKSKKFRETMNNKSEEEKLQAKQKQKNTFENKSEEEKKIEFEKRSKGNKGRNKGGTLLEYRCPYNENIIRKCSGFGNIDWYIKKYYPNLKQWSEFTKEEKQNYLIIQSSVMSSSLTEGSNP